MKPQRQLGRPKDIVKRDAILQTARDLFSRDGFEAVTMDRVAAQAGVSKMTVYSHFDDKETLFEHFVMSISDQMSEALAPAADGLPLEDRLLAMGRTFLTVVLGPNARAMLLTIPAVAQLNPSLAKRFYDVGPGRTRAALVAIIEEYAKRGELTVDRAEWAADDLLGLWEGGLPAKVLFAIDSHLTRAEITRRAKRAVEIFLRVYGRAARGERDASARRR